ncbi:CbiX/SirB N-terminal domain-containing protein [Pendulispora albinea]|uniref:NAD(P)H-dependent oxidoreductase subunit E n=1 Tax=Pendulispora albinea TaxID=2741071 RepID=A0ABZ2M243_9BACT
MHSAPWLPGADYTLATERPADTCVLLVGHGSRNPEANAEFESLADVYRQARTDLAVQIGYIELARPLVPEALAMAARMARRVAVVPLFLFSAGHVKNDLPLAIDEARRRFPSRTFAVAPALGVHPSLVAMAHDRVAPLLSDDAAQRARTMLLVAGRGSSDPDANADFCKLVRLIGDGRDLFDVQPSFMGITGPKVETSLDRIARMRPERLVVLPYLLFAGRLATRLTAQVAAFAERHPWIRASLAPHLGHDPRLFELIDERAAKALAGEDLLPCDTCQYRTALPGLAHQVGGLRALLYSVRHTLTHAQASMPVHMHKPLKKHVLVCCNTDCVDRGSTALLAALRREVKDAGHARTIKVTRTACMGRCGEGPTVAVYPDGVWYRGVREADAAEIVHEHLLEDRLVARLVDDILQ